jgi:uncharacterized protein (UPF0335 family)
MQETGGNSVQNGGKKLYKGRSQAEKVGRLKYILQQLERVAADVKETREMERVILNGLKGAGYFHFGRPMIERLACENRIDLEICEILHAAGSSGFFPKDVAARIGEGLKHYHVSRRIVRMNKRLMHETGERLFEKRGHRWALTSFAFEIWGEMKLTKGEQNF